MTINFSCPSVSVFYGENKTNREKLGKSEEKKWNLHTFYAITKLLAR